MHTTQYPDLFVTYRECFNMNTGKKTVVADKEIWFNQSSLSSPIVSDSVNKYYFPPLNVSINFGKVENDARTNTNLYYSINHVNKNLTIQEVNTLLHTCGLERTQLLTILEM